MLLILWALAFLSPILAIAFAVHFYREHRRRRPERARRMPIVAYVVLLLIAAGVGATLGLAAGIQIACTPPGAGNLCGLFGVFVGAPFGASLAVILIGAAILLIPADESAVPQPQSPPQVSATTAWYLRLWRGEYSLAVSFWFFLVLGTFVLSLIRTNPLLLFFPVALLLQPVLLAYEVAAVVGVWRSGNRFIAAGAAPMAATLKVVTAKAVSVLLVLFQAVLVLRMFALFAPHR